ncbi:MAG: 5'-3'-deoxyribonucleotidase [Verrucomicrobia bacterium]|nr:5'-3'-deoxyribonucleotidase [Verrucomicrobiota bacterium]
MHPTFSKRIAIDMDDVMADTLTVWLERYNQDFGTSITKADLHGKRIYDLVGPGRAATARAYLDHPEFFLDLPLMEGSQPVIKRLSEMYEVFVTSAAMDHPNSFPSKYVWLKKNFPFIPDKNIVFCGDKSIIRADFMIDDSVPNLTAFTGQGILFTAPHNVLDTTFPRVNGWLDVADYFGIAEALVV